MSDTRMIMLEAVARARIVEASYNGQRIKLAPHLMFERHGDQFVSALNLSKTRREGDEIKLGQFKLAGLQDPALQEEVFEPLPDYTPAPPREGDSLILSV